MVTNPVSATVDCFFEGNPLRTLRVLMGDIYIFAQHVIVYPEKGSCMFSAAPGSWLNPLTTLVKHGEVFDVFIRWSIPSAPMSL